MHMEFIDLSHWNNRNFKKEPYYVWISLDGKETCLKILKVKLNFIYTIEGKWLAPIPLHHRKNKNLNLEKDTPNMLKLLCLMVLIILIL